jgi:LacI family xylobiose transport system transcriptional regulator
VAITIRAVSSPATSADRPDGGRVDEAAGESATLAEIARVAGVSAPTVSKVLNGRGSVAAATRERIEVLLRRNGYRRRGLQAAPLLDLVFHDLESAWALEVIRGAERAVHEAGLSLVVSQSARSSTLGRSWLDGVLTRQPTGLLLVLSKLDAVQRGQLAGREIPFAVIDPTGDVEAGVPAVGATNWQGGFAATRHLIELGHRRIGVVAGPDRMLSSRAGVDGHRAALETAGLPVDPTLIRGGGLHRGAGNERGRQLLQLDDRPTAVFAVSDSLALGVYEAARDLGLRIPHDLSVIGFDDLAAARWVGPPLTTVRRPFAEMASAAARIVIGLARGEDRTRLSPRLELATELIVRSSTGPAPPRAEP